MLNSPIFNKIMSQVPQDQSSLSTGNIQIDNRSNLASLASTAASPWQLNLAAQNMQRIRNGEQSSLATPVDNTQPIVTRDGKLNPNLLKIVDQDLINRYGLKINSGYRDADKNASVGGAKGSQHLHGNAYD